jgi:transposase-like protein
MANKLEAAASSVVDELKADYLSDEDLAALHGVSPETVRRWRREHRAPPSVKVGRRHWTPRDAWREWLEGQTA